MKKFTRSQMDKSLTEPLMEAEEEGKGEGAEEKEKIDPKMPPGCIGQITKQCAQTTVKVGVGFLAAAI